MLNLVYSVDVTDKKESGSRFYIYQAAARYNTLLQLYRLPDAFAYFTRDCFKPTGVAL